MSDERRDRETRLRDVRLWKEARGAWLERVEGESPDPLVLAAYLDRKLDAAEAARVEAWMARSEDALDLVVAAQEAVATVPAPSDAQAVPGAVLKRAQGLVPPAPVARAPESSSPLAGWREALRRLLDSPFLVLRPVALSAATALAIVLASAGGVELGRGYAPAPEEAGSGMLEELALGDSIVEIL
jgi:hypothetical protein